jgi:hypothetical protein
LRNSERTKASPATGTAVRKTTWMACAYASTIGAICAGWWACRSAGVAIVAGFRPAARTAAGRVEPRTLA